MCKTLLLSQKENIIIAQCCNCSVMNIWRDGVVMNFSFQQFDAFYLSTRKLNFDDYLEIRPDGQEVVVLSTPFPDISLVFTRQDWQLFVEVMEEATFMKRVYELLNQES